MFVDICTYMLQYARTCVDMCRHFKAPYPPIETSVAPFGLHFDRTYFVSQADSGDGIPGCISTNNDSI